MQKSYIELCLVFMLSCAILLLLSHVPSLHAHTGSIICLANARLVYSMLVAAGLILYFYSNCYYICNGIARNEWKNGMLSGVSEKYNWQIDENGIEWANV